MNLGGTSYIPSYIPFSIRPIPSNAFLLTHPPHNPHGPSVWSASYNHVVPSSASTFVLGGYVPPYILGGQSFYQPYNYGYLAPHSQGVLNYNIHVYPFMGQVDRGYYLTKQGHSIYNNQIDVNQSY